MKTVKTPQTNHPLRHFDSLLGQLPGLSDKQLKAHFGLYEGNVKKVNEIDAKLSELSEEAKSSANYSYAEISELKRRHSVPFNGAYLHELYFEALSGQKSEPRGELAEQLKTDFGSVENWFNDVKSGLTSAHGWVLLTRTRDGHLCNAVVEEHHRGLLAGGEIILALDGWEHAYMIDYGTTKADYIKALEAMIDWNVAGRRFDRVLSSGLTLPEIGLARGIGAGATTGVSAMDKRETDEVDPLHQEPLVKYQDRRFKGA